MSERMLDLLRDLPAALGDLGHGDPDEPGRVLAADVVRWAAPEIARLREERRSITTLLGKVETLEADNERLRAERRAFCTVDGYPGKFEIKPLPPGPEANG